MVGKKIPHTDRLTHGILTAQHARGATKNQLKCVDTTLVVVYMLNVTFMFHLAVQQIVMSHYCMLNNMLVHLLQTLTVVVSQSSPGG